MGTVLGLEYERLTYLCGKGWLETRDHIALGQPADIALSAVCSALGVGRYGSRNIGEALALLEDVHYAVYLLLAVRGCEENMPYIDGIRNLCGSHDPAGIEYILVVGNDRRST